MAENRFLGGITASSIRNLLAKSVSSSQKINSNVRKLKFSSENVPPPDPNVEINDPPLASSLSFPKKLSTISHEELPKSEVQAASDPPVKVVVRIRPASGGDRTVRKVSADSISVDDRKFTFDSVLDINSTQEDVFRLVGVSMVKNALAGYNTSLLAYGQTASGKSYTMWGQPSSIVEKPSADGAQGIVARIFQMLFSEIQREQESSKGKQLNFQCRCSFLEIYNDQIEDLLDPMQRNLEIKDDTKNGFHVENLTEEYVTSYEDVTQLLIKGLSSRKVGATSYNSKSSRSHVVFSCIIESWCKENSSKGFGSSKTSRISLIDLAGFEGNVVDNAGKQCPMEGNFVQKSTSQLGHLVNILVDRNAHEKPEDVPYRSSCLTHFLKESLGGNAKLSVICSVSSDYKCTAETLSTLGFGQQVKLVQNVPVINEITEDDGNDLSDQIRHLKDELIRAKSKDSNSFGDDKYRFKGRSGREDLNQLRQSLHRSLILPRIDYSDAEEEVQINENDVKELQVQINNLQHEENSRGTFKKPDSTRLFTGSCEHYMSCSEESDKDEAPTELPKANDPAPESSIPIGAHHHHSGTLENPTLSDSPKIRNNHRKSINQLDEVQEIYKSLELSRQSKKPTEHIRSSLTSSRISSSPTVSLAASLHKGLEIIDYHQRNSPSNKSLASFSFEHFAMKPCPPIVEANDSVQALCVNCQQRGENELESLCKEQAAKMEQLEQMLMQYKQESEQKAIVVSTNATNLDENKLMRRSSSESHMMEFVKEKCEIHNFESKGFDENEREALLKEIEGLKSKLQFYTDPSTKKSTNMLRSSLLAQSIQLRKSRAYTQGMSEEELEKERERWTEMESEWISLTDDLRIDIESHRQQTENMEMELRLEKKCTQELDDALKRSVLGHAKMIEHYTELQDQYNDLVGKHRSMMEGVADIKRAVAKAGAKGQGSRYAKAMANELSALRVERDREKESLKKENRSLKIQLRDTVEAVHAAGEVLVRLREAEETAKVAEERFTDMQEENEKLKKQMEKLKRKHKTEITTMKQYLAESRLPEAALQPPIYREESDVENDNIEDSLPYDDDQAWRAEFGAIYQEQL